MNSAVLKGVLSFVKPAVCSHMIVFFNELVYPAKHLLRLGKIGSAICPSFFAHISKFSNKHDKVFQN